LPLHPVAPAAAPGLSPTTVGPTTGDPVPARAGRPVITGARPADPSAAAPGLPLVLPARLRPDAGIPAVRAGGAGGVAASRPVVLSLHAPGTDGAGPGAVPVPVPRPVVRERTGPERSAGSHRHAAHQRAPMPLVGPPAPGPARSTPDGPAGPGSPGPARRSAPTASPGALSGRSVAPTLGRRGGRGGAEARPGAVAAVDIDRIVDQVHRKFVRRLAVEGERRGAR
jgi:hypothetical protein